MFAKKILLVSIALIFLITTVNAIEVTVFSGSDSNIGTWQTVTANPLGDGEYNTWDNLNFPNECLVPINARFYSLKVKLGRAPGEHPPAIARREFTLRINGVDSLLTCSVYELETECSNDYFYADVEPGDTITLKTRALGSTGVYDTNAVWSMKYSTNGNESFFCGNGSAASVTTATSYMPLTGQHNFYNTTEFRTETIVPTSGTFKNLFVEVKTAPGQDVNGIDQNRIFTMRKNTGVGGSNTSVLCKIAGSNTTCNDTSHSFTISAGQKTTLKSSVEGTPPNSKVIYGIGFIADSEKYFFGASSNTDTTDTTNTEYDTVWAGQTNLSTAITNQQALGQEGKSSVFIDSMNVEIDSVPGSASGRNKSIKFTLFRNNAATGLTCTISGDAETTCSSGADVSVLNGDLFNVEIDPNLTPDAKYFHYSFLVSSIPMARTVIYGAKLYGAKIY